MTVDSGGAQRGDDEHGQEQESFARLDKAPLTQDMWTHSLCVLRPPGGREMVEMVEMARIGDKMAWIYYMLGLRTVPILTPLEEL